MYTEEYERRGFPFRDFLLKLILVIIFVFLLIWLLPKFIRPTVTTNATSNSKAAATEKSSSKSSSSSTKCESNSGKCDISGLDALTSQIFAENINRMKEAAISYYTDERLPKNSGDSEKMTLSDMISKKIIIALVDKNNKAVDGEKSYVKITKLDEEYILKINIKDSEKEDYMLVHLGCYTYCDSYVCQKQSSEVSVKGSKVTDTVPIKGSYDNGEYVAPKQPTVVVEKHYCVKYNGKYYGMDGSVVSKNKYLDQCTEHKEDTHYCVKYNGKYYDTEGKVVSKTVYTEKCVPSKEEKHYCVKYNGKYYDNEGNVVSKTVYTEKCTTEKVEKYYCVYYNGKFYGKEGTVVSESDYRNQCFSKEEKHYCTNINGKYYGVNGNIVNKETYEDECIPKEEEKHYCAYYKGSYYGLNGEVVSKEQYNKECLHIEEKYTCQKHDGKYYGLDGSVVSYDEYKEQCEKKKEYIYEYKKVKQASFSNWTAWSSWSKTNCATQEINCSDTDVNCLRKLQLYKRKEQIGTYQKAYTKTREQLVQTGSYTEKACSKYNYVEINKTTYATTTTTTYTTINTVTSSTRSSSASWKYNGRASYSNPPRDTANTHYKFVGADYSYCSDTCTTLPNYYYDSYTYQGGLSQVTNTTVTPQTSTSTSSSTSTSYDASCGEYVWKEVPVYSTIIATEKDYRTEPLYGDVCYQSTKTRQLLVAGSTEYKWSSYNDTTLLGSGWYYTGNYKLK